MEPGTAVHFVNGQRAAAIGQGEVILQVQITSGNSEVKLMNVLHVPEAKVNIFSTRQVMNSGAQLTFRDDKCYVFVGCNEHLQGISQEDGMMVIKQVSQQPAVAMAFKTAIKETPELWHRCFGHLGYDNLLKLKKKNMVEGISVPAEDFKQQQEQKPLCEICLCSKQHRLPFPDSDSRSADLLELVHMDVCGPMPVTSTTTARYLATFIDDHSRLSHVVPLKHKSEVATAVKATIKMLETQSGKRLKAVRTDNGTEYVNSELQAYFSSKGVLHNTTAPYTPEQNGVAERFNRTLIERVRAMLLDAQLEEE